MATNQRVVVTAPGGMGGPYAPLPMFATDAAEARGAEPRPIWWQDAEQVLTMPPEQVGPWVQAQVAPVLEGTDAPNTLLVGKSLGTHAAALAADRGHPAVWLAPVLTRPWVVDALRRATAPFLLVGGTRDQLWDSALARDLSPYLLEVEDADHGMYVPGRLAASAAVLGQVATAVEDFLDQVVWPAHRTD